MKTKLIPPNTCYCKEGMVDEARATFEYMTERGHAPNIFTYCALIDGYWLCAEMDEVEKLINMVAKDGCQPDVVTFNSLINGYCKSKIVEKGLILLCKMPLKELTPNAHMYTSAFKEMKAQGVKLGLFTWSMLINGFCKNVKLDEALETIKEMENNGVVPDVFIYNSLMDGVCEGGRLGEALDVFSLLVDRRLQPNVRSYTIIIKGFCNKGLITDAEEVFKKMEDNGCSNDCTFNTLIKGFLDSKDVNRAVTLVSIMRSKEFMTDNYTISSLLGLLANPNVSDADKCIIRKFFEI
ncbi:hypothetical protein RDABS01_029640 [Bienertia sinuspersici]